jgi:hypothetical protein
MARLVPPFARRALPFLRTFNVVKVDLAGSILSPKVSLGELKLSNSVTFLRIGCDVHE